MPAAMPGQSYAGPLPPMTDAERQLSAGLKTRVLTIGGSIGERNVWKYDKLEAAAGYIEGELKKLGYEPDRQTYAAGGKAVRNIDTTLRGSGSGASADEVVIVGAHYDSVRGAPGANDNGTGVAATLELARLLKDSSPARTVRFVLFVNEEPPFFQTGLMGSVVYARRCRQRGEKIVGMLSLETIGFYSDERGSQQYPPPFNRYFPDTGNFIAFVGDDSAAEFVTRCVGSFRTHTKFPSEGGALPDEIEGVGWSDHWAFTRQGYPALMVTDTAPFRYRHYHTAGDTPDKVDYDRTARVTAGVTRVVEELAGASRPAPGTPGEG
jgi:hypothetical protein